MAGEGGEGVRPGRLVAILLAIVLVAVGAWLLLREDGMLERVTETRVERALIDNGMPEPMAGCMAPRLVDRLTGEQLRKLERLAPEEGESAVPRSIREALDRLNRVDDPEAVEALASATAGCGVELLRERF
ncbi:MAG: hypothetical protein V2I39_09660 [Erythrobacter sp.]|jgi:hypothetical protein|nr:hypothetical protein [Erythrobacter sp.]